MVELQEGLVNLHSSHNSSGIIQWTETVQLHPKAPSMSNLCVSRWLEKKANNSEFESQAHSHKEVVHFWFIVTVGLCLMFYIPIVHIYCILSQDIGIGAGWGYKISDLETCNGKKMQMQFSENDIISEIYIRSAMDCRQPCMMDGCMGN